MKFDIDAGGVTPIEVNNRKYSNNVTFREGATLDVSFLDDSARVGSWDVMTWQGKLTDKGLSFADTVDKDTWNFHFVDTEGDGSPDTLRVSAIPHRADRIASVRKLDGKVSDKAVHSLLQVLKGEKQEDRLAAIETLKGMGTDSAPALSSRHANPVVEVMIKHSSLLPSSMDALIAAGVAEEFVPHLMNMLEAENTDMFQKAFNALAMIGPSALEKTDSHLASIYRGSNGVEAGRGPDELDASNLFFRFTDSGSTADVELEFDPEEQNYVTVKMWGGSGRAGVLVVKGPSGGNRLMKMRKGAPHPGRFFYATTELPVSKDTESPATFTLETIGGNTGLDIYEVYVHRNPFIRPPEDELQGEPLELGDPKPAQHDMSGDELTGHWRSIANEGFEKVFEGDYQIYGDKARELIEEGDFPAWTRGAILARKPGSTNLGKYRKRDAEVQQYGGWLLHQTDTRFRGAARTMQILAQAYTKEWSDYYQSEEVLERFVAAMDFYSLMQGVRGFFRGPGGKGSEKWIGAPDRDDYGAQNINAGEKHLWKAYNMMHEPLREAGHLKEPFERTLDPDTEGLPRGEVYAQMAIRMYDGYGRKTIRRNVANQAMHNFIPLARAHKALKKLDPAAARERESRIRELSEIVGGLKKDPDTNEFIYSPAGISNEAGWSGNYGSGNPFLLAEIAEATDYDFLKQKVKQNYHARGKYLYLRNLPHGNDGYIAKLRPEAISRRNVVGLPGRHEYYTRPESNYAAWELEIPAVKRSLKLVDEHNRLPYQESLKAVIDLYQNYHRGIHAVANRAERSLKSLPTETDYRFPTEREGTTVFLDPYIESAAIHRGDSVFHIRFEWERRLPYAKMSYKTPRFDRYAFFTAQHAGPVKAGEKFDGSKRGRPNKIVKWLRYGPYFLLFNGSPEKSYKWDVPDELRGRRLKDLISGEYVTLEATEQMEPFEKYVFLMDESSY